MPNQIQPLQQQLPEFIAPVGEKVNELARALRPLLNLKSGTGMKVIVSGTDILFEVEGGGGAGLPAGYTFTEFTICDSGTPATRWWPVWTTNPEA